MSSHRRLQRLAVVAVGTLATGAMVWLGLWQMQVFRDQGQADAQARTELPAVALEEQLRRPATDTYGRQVFASGTYLPDEVLRIGSGATPTRVLQGFRLLDGTVLPVVRGIGDGPVPAAPAGTVTVTGLLLASERNIPVAAGADMGSVRLPALAQRWPHNLVGGYVALRDGEPGTQGLAAAPVVLPAKEGNLRNGGYAVQWWVFAGFAVALTVAVTRSMKDKESP